MTTSERRAGGSCRAALAEIAEDFSSVSARERLQLLLEFSDELPALPERYRRARGAAGAGGRVPVPALPRGRGRPTGRRRGAVVHLFFHAPRGGADDPRVRRHPARGPGRADRRRGARGARRRAVPVRPVRGRVAAAAARHGGDAGPDQAPGPAQVRRRARPSQPARSAPSAARRRRGRCRRPRRSRRGGRRRSTPGARSCAARAGPSSSGAATPAAGRAPTAVVTVRIWLTHSVRSTAPGWVHGSAPPPRSSPTPFSHRRRPLKRRGQVEPLHAGDAGGGHRGGDGAVDGRQRGAVGPVGVLVPEAAAADGLPGQLALAVAEPGAGGIGDA